MSADKSPRKYEEPAPVDPSEPEIRIFWAAPGGGVEPGVTFEQVGPGLWSRERTATFDDEVVLFRAGTYVVALPALAPAGAATESSILGADLHTGQRC